jgi:hypothetical protein
MSASLRQAPCNTALAIRANSISALARQALSRLGEARFAPLRRARDKSARSKHACSAMAPTRFALCRWAPVKSAPLSKARSILIPRRLRPEKSRPARSADEKFAPEPGLCHRPAPTSARRTCVAPDSVMQRPHVEHKKGWSGLTACLEEFIGRGEQLCLQPDRSQKTADRLADCLIIVDDNDDGYRLGRCQLSA